MVHDDHYEALLSALKDGTLHPVGFSHRDHMGVAVALRRHSFFEAMLIIANGLQAVTQRAGVPEKLTRPSPWRA